METKCDSGCDKVYWANETLYYETFWHITLGMRNKRSIPVGTVQGSVQPTDPMVFHICKVRKARSRRGRAAFPKVGATVMVELGLHNPLAAALGAKGESEMVLAKRVLAAQPKKGLLLSDRYYGVAELLVGSSAEAERHFRVRVKTKLKRRFLEAYADGSALVEIRSKQGTRLGREIIGRVQRAGRGASTTVRFWTSLLDWRRHPAAELLALYARRWEQEVSYKELKVDTRSTPCLQTHTPLTAMQEIAALILAYAVLVDYRVEAASVGEVGVLRIILGAIGHAVLRAVQGGQEPPAPKGVFVPKLADHGPKHPLHQLGKNLPGQARPPIRILTMPKWRTLS